MKFFVAHQSFDECDQRGRAAYPLRLVSFLGSEPSAFTLQSWRCAPCPAPEKTASVLESGAHAGSKSVLSPLIGILINIAGAFPDVSRTKVCFDVDAAVDCTHATCLPSGESAMSPYRTVLPSCSVSCCMV